MNSLTEHIEISRYNDGEITVTQDTVIKEYNLHINIDDKSMHRISCTQTSLQELLIGYMLGKDLINDYSGIQEITIDEDQNTAYVRTISRPNNIINKMNDKQHLRIPARHILDTVSQCNKRSELFQSTGSVHYCALCSGSGILRFEEDISRHNALDKIIGYAALNQILPDTCYIISSGRISHDILKKIIKTALPLAVSISAATDAAVRLAKEHNVTLVGFARGKRMNIYSCPQRIIC